jgi:hypothetical protein
MIPFRLFLILFLIISFKFKYFRFTSLTDYDAILRILLDHIFYDLGNCLKSSYVQADTSVLTDMTLLDLNYYYLPWPYWENETGLGLLPIDDRLRRIGPSVGLPIWL